MYSSYCLTFRPRGGLKEPTEIAVVKWLKKQDYAYATIEEEGEARHLHAQIWLDNPRNKGEIVRSLKRIGERTIEEWDSRQAVVLSSGVKIAYSDFYLSYLNHAEKKADDETNVIYSKVPDRTEGYYPTEEEQKEVQEASKAVDKRYHRISEMYKNWEKYERTFDLWNVSLFVEDAMFKSKTLPVIQDPRVCKQFVKALHAYTNESMDMRHFMNKEDYDIALEMEGIRNDK